VCVGFMSSRMQGHWGSIPSFFRGPTLPFHSALFSLLSTYHSLSCIFHPPLSVSSVFAFSSTSPRLVDGSRSSSYDKSSSFSQVSANFSQRPVSPMGSANASYRLAGGPHRTERARRVYALYGEWLPSTNVFRISHKISDFGGILV